MPTNTRYIRKGIVSIGILFTAAGLISALSTFGLGKVYASVLLMLGVSVAATYFVASKFLKSRHIEPTFKTGRTIGIILFTIILVWFAFKSLMTLSAVVGQPAETLALPAITALFYIAWLLAFIAGCFAARMPKSVVVN
ncbi:MAG: hypothetical protein G01um10148_1 [Parcubacteria group bacterium Gr01-1014_8]|nr:MAG: hypothetical protein G01um10148_1 [Parcubacteria group bacterium Gr01-1014_8]